MPTPKEEICSIRIMFPIESDEQAIDLKKKIKAVFPDDTDAHFTFEIMTMPVRPSVPKL